ncbi:MAG TPA: tRNA lysidine(34) synthetase TilS [Chitinophagales bacterium]|nr:tRNA lysidine(34) synthetase TilS [Chitinophagales bacterium]
MDELLPRFLNFIRDENLFGKNDPVLLAVSGGIDSAVMAHLFYECNFSFGIAHANFQLREKDSEADENFVCDLAAKFDKRIFSVRFNTKEFAKENKVSVQMAARELRYSWLEEIRKDNGFHRIATAHHLDDSIETVFINMIRGTGIHGLHGILPKQNKIVRPLLCFFKKEIEEYATEKRISFRQDQSNYETGYDRNKIRLEVIPAIEKHFPFFKKNFTENTTRWRDAGSLYDDALTRVKKKAVVKRNQEEWISIPALKQQSAYKTILFEVLKEFHFNSDQTEQIVSALDAESGKIFFSPTHRLIKDRKHLIVSPLTATSLSEVLINEHDHRIPVTLSSVEGQLQISERDAEGFSIPQDSSISCLDKSELEFPLVLRKWKKGDYFYPFGMKRKKKKISDYLIDKKIPLNEKENIWVIESGKRIACIIGERIDERFKVTSSTEKVIVIEKP